MSWCLEKRTVNVVTDAAACVSLSSINDVKQPVEGEPSTKTNRAKVCPRSNDRLVQSFRSFARGGVLTERRFPCQQPFFSHHQRRAASPGDENLR
jgi:hypothetical protein